MSSWTPILRGSFRIQTIILQISLYIEAIFDIKSVPKRADVTMSPKNLQYDYPKMRGREGGGAKGRLDLFRFS